MSVTCAIKEIYSTCNAIFYFRTNCISGFHAPLSNKDIRKKFQSLQFFTFLFFIVSGGWNNNPSCRQFSYIYRRLLSRAGVIPSVTANVAPQDGSELTSSEEVDNFEYNHAVDEVIFSQFTNNVLTYICGWIVRKVTSTLKCSKCCDALVKVPESTNEDSILLRLKDNGGLLYPNDDVRKIVFTTEKALKFEPSLKFKKSKLVYSVLRHLELHKLFIEQEEHFNDTSTLWSNHLLSLVKVIISTYIDLRLHHAAKQRNLSEADANVRQILSRTVIFRHQ